MRRLCCLLALALGLAGAAGTPSAGEIEAQRADIAAFRTHALAVDRSYAAAARTEAATRLARLDASAGKVSRAYFELELGRIAALADNGHTGIFPGQSSRHFNRIALRLVPMDGGFVVLRALAADADLLGARVLAIDRRPLAAVLAVARSLHGGSAARRDRFVPNFLESPEQMHALGVADAADAVRVRFRRRDGSEIERQFTARPAGADGSWNEARDWFFPQRMPGGADDWRAPLDPNQAPWSLREHETPFRWREGPEIEGLVIELRQNSDDRTRPIADFLSEVERRLRAARPRNLVLDMRWNGGGDLNNTRDFAERLPDLVAERIFVLTSPWTFSAAISTVGYLEQRAPARVTIVGETVGDRLEFFAEGRPIRLPESGLYVSIATQRHDYRDGCRGQSDCHFAVVRRPIAVPTLDPDIAAPWTVDAYRSGRDPGMEAVAKALGR